MKYTPEPMGVQSCPQRRDSRRLHVLLKPPLLQLYSKKRPLKGLQFLFHIINSFIN